MTGASGFVGSRLVEALLDDGWQVRRLARPGSRGAWPPVGMAPAAAAAVETCVAPLDDASALARSGALDDVDVVFHVAGVTRARTANAFTAGNVAPTRALLDALHTVYGGGAPRGVLVSSQAAAGAAAGAGQPRTEDDPAAPVGAYGASKHAAEGVVAGHPAGARWTVVRPCAVYGPRDRDFLPLFRQIEHGLVLYPGTREGWLSLVHVADLAQALLLAGTVQAAAGRSYFVAGHEAVAWPSLYAAMTAAAGVPLRLALDLPAPLLALAGAAGDLWSALTGRSVLAGREKLALARPRWWLCSADRARAELGWQSDRTLAAGIAETRDWYRQAGWL